VKTHNEGGVLFFLIGSFIGFGGTPTEATNNLNKMTYILYVLIGPTLLHKYSLLTFPKIYKRSLFLRTNSYI
jgi:hypothetical protein